LRRALESTLALKTALRYSAITDASGATIVGLQRPQSNAPPSDVPASPMPAAALVAQVRAQPDGGTAIGFVDGAGSRQLALASSICAGPPGCAPAGIAVVAVDARQLLPSKIDAAIYDSTGRQVAARGLAPVQSGPASAAGDRVVRREGRRNRKAAVTAYSR